MMSSTLNRTAPTESVNSNAIDRTDRTSKSLIRDRRRMSTSTVFQPALSSVEGDCQEDFSDTTVRRRSSRGDST